MVQFSTVASFTDAWIETNMSIEFNAGLRVASFTDAYHETAIACNPNPYTVSHLLQMRGLKPVRML